MTSLIWVRSYWRSDQITWSNWSYNGAFGNSQFDEIGADIGEGVIMEHFYYCVHHAATISAPPPAAAPNAEHQWRANEPLHFVGWTDSTLDFNCHLNHHPGMHEREESPGSNAANLPRVLSVLDLLTEGELVQLNHIVVQRLRLMQQIRAHGQMMSYHIGQKVRFRSSAGELVEGTITRHNRKSLSLVTPAGEHWRISPALIEPE
jgi:hypothetical protein